jgi:hypothetical protein
MSSAKPEKVVPPPASIASKISFILAFKVVWTTP